MENGSKKVLKVLEFSKTHFYYNYQPFYIVKVEYKNIIYKSEKFLLPNSLNINMNAVVDIYIIDEKNYYIDIISIRENNEIDF